MKNTVLINLSGHAASFKAEQDAYEALRRYLDRAQRSLQADPDHEEVLRDLEQSIGDKLSARQSSAEHVLTLAGMNAVLAEVGPVGGEDAGATPRTLLPRWRRPLVRIKENQEWLGVCTGLSAFSEIRLDWVRFIMLVLAGISGIGVIVYLALGFLLPLVETNADYEELLRKAEQAHSN